MAEFNMGGAAEFKLKYQSSINNIDTKISAKKAELANQQANVASQEQSDDQEYSIDTSQIDNLNAEIRNLTEEKEEVRKTSIEAAQEERQKLIDERDNGSKGERPKSPDESDGAKGVQPTSKEKDLDTQIEQFDKVIGDMQNPFANLM